MGGSKIHHSYFNLHLTDNAHSAPQTQLPSLTLKFTCISLNIALSTYRYWQVFPAIPCDHLISSPLPHFFDKPKEKPQSMNDNHSVTFASLRIKKTRVLLLKTARRPRPFESLYISME